MDPASKASLPSSRAGRPRSERCRRKILAAAEALLAEHGVAGMSVDAIAEVAGVSKATIYRWWPNKAAVVMEALLGAIGRLLDGRRWRCGRGSDHPYPPDHRVVPQPEG